VGGWVGRCSNSTDVCGSVLARGVCVSKYALRTCEQQSTPEEQAIKQKSLAPFQELMSGVYRVDFYMKQCFLGSLRNALKVCVRGGGGSGGFTTAPVAVLSLIPPIILVQTGVGVGLGTGGVRGRDRVGYLCLVRQAAQQDCSSSGQADHRHGMH